MDSLDDHRWRAVVTRDPQSQGVFVYAVASTRVYCRPGCSSRQPLRRNVTFFATPDEARSAGYRACRRCRPDDLAVDDLSLAAVVALCRRVEATEESLDVGAFAHDVGYSERHLRRRFREVLGVTIAQYARFQRSELARAALAAKVPVTDAIYQAGYGSSRAFYEHGATRLGMSPSTFQAGGAGEVISFTTLETPLGVVLGARTHRGVCAVRIGPDEKALIDELTLEFPHARRERDDEGLGDLALVLARAVRGEATDALPLDLAGTAFQIRVWQILCTVPRGTTLTYSQVAERMGEPRAVRAVGSACGANPTALLVPCHRVVRRDGSLGGYRWGLEVKAALLDLERAPR